MSTIGRQGPLNYYLHQARQQNLASLCLPEGLGNCMIVTLCCKFDSQFVIYIFSCKFERVASGPVWAWSPACAAFKCKFMTRATRDSTEMASEGRWVGGTWWVKFPGKHSPQAAIQANTLVPKNQTANRIRKTFFGWERRGRERGGRRQSGKQ